MAVDLKEVRPWNGSQHEAFEELCCQLASFESVPGGSLFRRKRGAGGDAGVECYWLLPNGDEIAWQTKYLFGLGDGEWKQLDQSVETALAKHPRMVSYTICLPIDRAEARKERAAKSKGRRVKERSMMDRWDVHVEKWKKWAAKRRMRVEFRYWGQHEILERLSRPQPQYAGRTYFWFNQQDFSADWMRRHFAEKRESAGGRYTPEIHVDLPEAQLFEGLGRTDAFFNRLEELYGRLCRKWTSATPSQRLREDAPDVAGALDAWGQSVATLAAALRAVERDSISPIDFPQLAALARKVIVEGDACLEKSREPRPQKVEGVEPDAANRHGLSLGELLGGVRLEVGQVQRAAREIRSFATGDAASCANTGALLLVAEAGKGKTHLFCDVAERRIKDSLPTVLLLGQHFSNEEPWAQIIKQLHLSCRTRDEFLGVLDAAAQARGGRALIMIDALNEGDGKRLWRHHLAGMLSVLRDYPRIGLAVSCRTSYERVVVPNGLGPELLRRVEHQGFASHEYIATRTFFDHYGIERPNVPLLIPEFSNPLFLKLFCEGLRRHELTRIPAGVRGITQIFNLFVAAVNFALSQPDRLDFDERSKPVERAVMALARRMAETNEPWVEMEEARAIVDGVLPRAGGYHQSLFANLLGEGLLSEDLVYPTGVWDAAEEARETEVIRFPYEKFTDHFIVRHLLDTYLNERKPAGSFAKSRPLGKLFAEQSATWRIVGWVEALCIQLPERTGREFVELVPKARPWDAVSRAFLQSLVWRDPAKVSEAALGYLDELYRGPNGVTPVYDVLLTVAVNPEHPFNAAFLHRHLSGLKMPDRDAVWSIYLFEQYGGKGAVDRLLEWAWEAEKSHISDEAIELCAVTLGWFLTTSQRFLRDRTTKAMVAMLQSRPRVLIRVIERFLDVDDLYVLERLYAVAYGVAMLSDHEEGVRELALKVYGWVFEHRRPPAHILLRDYARGVIESAAHRGLLDPSIDITLARPPYRSSYPLDVPSQEELEKLIPKSKGSDYDGRALDHLCQSVTGFEDFARYVIGTNSSEFEWSTRRLGAKPEPSLSQRFKQFVDSLTERQREAWDRYFKLRNIVQVLARLSDEEREKRLKAKVTKKQLGGLVALEEQGFLKTLRGEKRLVFLKYVTAYLKNPTKDEYRFDLSVAQRWILKRVFELGWTEERFATFDGLLVWQHGREPDKPERIGKKYQWIAYHEFLAHVADNLEFRGNRWSDEPQVYEGPWQIGARDIDPSLLVRSLPNREGTQRANAWWRPVAYEFPETGIEGQAEWIARAGDCPDPRRLIKIVQPGSGKAWLTLEGSYKWTEQEPIEEDRYENPRRQMWYVVRAYIVRRGHLKKLTTWLKGKNFMGDWMPKPVEMYEVFVGEYPWAPACKEKLGDEDWVTGDRLPYPVVITATDYVCERGTFDCSIDETVSASMPSSWMIREMGLRWSGGRFTFVDSSNELVAFDPSAQETGPSALLISLEKLNPFLLRNDLEVIWTVLGERHLIGGRREQWKGWLQFSGVYWLSKGEIVGPPLISWHETPETRRARRGGKTRGRSRPRGSVKIEVAPTGETGQTTVCPHQPGGGRQVLNGQLLPEAEPCKICGMPKPIHVMIYDTQESLDQFPPESVRHLWFGDEPPKIIVGVSFNEV